MEPSSTLQGLSLKKDPRPGQRRVFEAWEEIVKSGGKTLNIKLPTGYGKTFTALVCYSILKRDMKANRILFIVPSTAQLSQLEKDGPGEMSSAGVSGPTSFIDVGYFGAEGLRKHRRNESQAYAITVQALIQRRGSDNVKDLLGTGQWMFVVDEYHHYAVDKSWGKTVVEFPYTFLLAMSATPYRRENDSAFGEPAVSVTYRQAEAERAVKKLIGHSYNYKLDAATENGQILSFTTEELISAVGSDSPDAIEKFRLTRKMRWSPKYVSPLISVPIIRMEKERIATGYKLQAIIGAMCVSHAELVCEQVKAMFPHLTVDWVGTGENGRDRSVNEEVLAKFCPPKDEYGRRKPTLDVLVHVGMAGEGLDSTHVSEVIHLNKASLNNSNNQENGRAARYLESCGEPVVANINFDASSEYAMKRYVGPAIMDAMDDDPPQMDIEEEEYEKRERGCPSELPEEPQIQLFNLELISIDSGTPGFDTWAKVVSQKTNIPIERLMDETSPEFSDLVKGFKAMLRKEAEASNEKATICQWREAVDSAVSVVAGLVIRKLSVPGSRTEKSLAGDIRRVINGRKKYHLGAISENVETCRRHYEWIRSLEREIRDRGVPEWLK